MKKIIFTTLITLMTVFSTLTFAAEPVYVTNTQTAELLSRFYTAFANRDYETMASLYHPEAKFNDAIFKDLNYKQTTAMWHMILSGAQDLNMTFEIQQATEFSGKVKWVADYNYPGFFGIQNAVHNVSLGEIQIKDGKIFRHTDRYNLTKWISMALGVPTMLADSTIMQALVQHQAKTGLALFIINNPKYH